MICVWYMCIHSCMCIHIGVHVCGDLLLPVLPPSLSPYFLRQSLLLSQVLTDWSRLVARMLQGSAPHCLFPELESKVHTVAPTFYKGHGGLDSGTHVSTSP